MKNKKIVSKNGALNKLAPLIHDELMNWAKKFYLMSKRFERYSLELERYLKKVNEK